MRNAELVFISALLNTGGMNQAVGAGVSANWFHTYEKEWRFIEKYYKHHSKVPSPSLFKIRYRDIRLSKVDDLEYAIEELKVHHAKQSLLDVLADVGERINSEPVDKLMAEVQRTITSVTADIDGTRNEVDALGDWKDVYATVKSMQKRATESGIPGIPTGFKTLDSATGGLRPGDFWVFAARLGQGKTWALVRIAVEAVLAGYRVQMNSLEQPATQITMRMHAFLAQHLGFKSITAFDITNGKVDLAVYKKLLRKIEREVPGSFIVNDTSRGRLTPMSLAAQIERNQPNIVLLDYIQLMAKQKGDWTEIASLSGDIAGLCLKYKVPIIAAAQLNRSGATKRPPDASYLAGSDAIGQDAAGVVTMAQRSDHVTEMHLAKYRHGRDGLYWFNEFRPNSGIFREITSDKAMDIIDTDMEREDDI